MDSIGRPRAVSSSARLTFSAVSLRRGCPPDFGSKLQSVLMVFYLSPLSRSIMQLAPMLFGNGQCNRSGSSTADG